MRPSDLRLNLQPARLAAQFALVRFRAAVVRPAGEPTKPFRVTPGASEPEAVVIGAAGAGDGAMKPYYLRVRQVSDGSFMVTGSVPGLLLWGDDPSVLLADAPAAVKLLRELNGVDREDPWRAR
jgi:hypothetical protein